MRTFVYILFYSKREISLLVNKADWSHFHYLSEIVLEIHICRPNCGGFIGPYQIEMEIKLDLSLSIWVVL